MLEQSIKLRVWRQHYMSPDLASTTPLVTCLLRALDGHDPESLSTGWYHGYLDTRVRQ